MTMRVSPVTLANGFIRLVLVTLVIGCSALSAQAREVDIRIVESDTRGLTLLMTAPEANLLAVPGTDARWYQLAPGNMALTRVPGQPALPQQGVLVGIPRDATLSLTITDVRYDEIADRTLVPNLPRQQQNDIPLWQLIDHYIDQGFYAQDSLLPELPVSIGFTGQLRDQPVAQILFHPLQVNPVAERLRVYRQLRVRVAFDRPLPSTDAVDNSSRVLSVSIPGQAEIDADPFATLLHQSLINAGQAGR